MRAFTLDSIHAVLAGQTEWSRDDRFSIPGAEIWWRLAKDGWQQARLHIVPARGGQPPLVLEASLVGFCGELDRDARLFIDAVMSRGGLWHGAIDW